MRVEFFLSLSAHTTQAGPFLVPVHEEVHFKCSLVLFSPSFLPPGHRCAVWLVASGGSGVVVLEKDDCCCVAVCLCACVPVSMVGWWWMDETTGDCIYIYRCLWVHSFMHVVSTVY